MTTTVLETLVGEGKKFQSAEQLAEAKVQSDQYIETLKAQLDGLKAQVDAGASVSAGAIESILAEIKQSKSGQPAVTSSERTNNQGAQPLTEAEVLKIVERQHAQQAQAIVRAQTLDQVKRVYGNQSDEFLTKLAGDTGFTVDQLKNMAGTQPAAFLRIANLGQPRQVQGSPGATVNSQALTSTSNTDGTIRDKSYWEAKRKEVGAKKFAFDSSLNTQMHADMQRLGDRWDPDM